MEITSNRVRWYFLNLKVWHTGYIRVTDDSTGAAREIIDDKIAPI